MMNRIADSGDILLFTCNDFMSGVQRSITGSEYDHIAMFLRFANGQLVYFESSANVGCQIFSWDYFFNNNIQKNFKKLAFRKLRVKRSKEKLADLEKFVQQVRGNSYNLTLTKLFETTNDEDVKNVKKTKAYFCSELIASCHKVLDVFPEELASTQYWPSTFALPSPEINDNWVTKGSDAYFEDLQEILF